MNKFEDAALTGARWLLYLVTVYVVFDGVQLAAMRQSRDRLTLVGLGFLAILSFLSASRLKTLSLWPKLAAVAVFIYLSILLLLAISTNGFSVARTAGIFIFFIFIAALLKQVAIRKIRDRLNAGQ